MFEVKDHLENRKGILFIDGVNPLDLAKKYDTPLYVYSESAIRKRCKTLIETFSKYCSRFKASYAIKANNNLALLKIIKSEGFGFDASCPEEIELALMADADKKDILYTGAYHRNDELDYGLKRGVRINLDGISQLKRLLSIGKPDFISFRVNPGIAGGNIKGLIFAGPDAKFGIHEDYVIKAYRIAKEAGIKRFGIHMMTGSCVLDEKYFEEATSKLLDIAGKVKAELGIEFEIIDIGGGLGVTYKPGEKEIDIKYVAKHVAKVFKEKVKKYSLGEPYLMIEPGRYIVCESGILLTRVHSIKNADKRFVGVDAGMNNFLRPMLYEAYHHIVAANQLNEKPSEKVNVVGPICENTDQIAKDRMLPSLEEGDLLAVLNAGAYGFSMGSRYNSRPMCSEVLINDGKSELIRRRETIEDINRNVVVPKRLK